MYNKKIKNILKKYKKFLTFFEKHVDISPEFQ